GGVGPEQHRTERLDQGTAGREGLAPRRVEGEHAARASRRIAAEAEDADAVAEVVAGAEHARHAVRIGEEDAAPDLGDGPEACAERDARHVADDRIAELEER